MALTQRRELKRRESETGLMNFPLSSIHGFPFVLETSESFPSRFRVTSSLRRRSWCFLRYRRRRCSSPQIFSRNHLPRSLVLLRHPPRFLRWQKRCRRTYHALSSDRGWAQTLTMYAGSWDSVTVPQRQCTPIVNEKIINNWCISY